VISIWIGLLLLGCTSQDTGSLKLPDSLPGGWTHGATRDLSTDGAPGEIRALGVSRAVEADYQGPRQLKVIVYVMNSPTGAFEAAQKWRHREGALAFHEERYLVVVDAPQLSKTERDSAAEAISKSLK
jgi:hypothetical protein